MSSILSDQLFPEVIDGTTLNERVTSALFLPIAVEGWADSGGTASVGVLELISRPSDADALYGPASSLASLVKFVLDQGGGPVYAIASAKGAVSPTLIQRQAAWQTLEATKEVRIRLTDSVLEADHAALAVSCDNANLLNNKQFCVVGMASAIAKAGFISAADTIATDSDAAKRAVLIAPSVYDSTGTLRTGAYAAAAVAARLAINPDPADDLDTADLPNLTGIERDASGNDLFRILVVGGVVQNDFEDLLQEGVSPLMPGLNGGVAISHLRTTYKTDSTFDSLMTRIIADQVFILVRDYAYRFNQLRKGNTEVTRESLRSGIDALLNTVRDWIEPITLGDGTIGYGVVVSASPDERQQIISYNGEVVRGVSTLVVAGNLTIPA